MKISGSRNQRYYLKHHNQNVELEALSRTTLKQFEQYIKLNKKIPSEVLVSFGQIEDAGKLRIVLLRIW